MENRNSRNRTIIINDQDREIFEKELYLMGTKTDQEEIENKIINDDFFTVVDKLPDKFVDLLFLDPPYNLHKTFNSVKFKKQSIDDYAEYFENIISKSYRLLKPDASIYVCGDWLSSTSFHLVLEKYFHIRNRITWEREKGRGAQVNWKSNSEDLWFCTMNNNYTFNIEDVKLRKKVIAPYRTDDGTPKDWKSEVDGSFRLTHPSNIWTDISVPFWSMPENTEHPTQKPEKLIARVILASSNKGDVVFDPFSGSGTTCVVAKKLGRKFLGIELDKKFALTTLKRLSMADDNNEIQGYYDGVFWERNTYSIVKRLKSEEI